MVINGVSFSPHPDIGFLSDEKGIALPKDQLKPCLYKFNYINIATRIASKEWPELDTYRQLIKDDLWFILYFIVKPFADEAGRTMVNHPFTVRYCREIEQGPKDFTLDLAARFHYKSSIITTAETIQFQLNNPEYCTGIFSHKAPVAKDFLFSIKQTFQRERILSACFPDVVWENCEKEAPLWSLDEGIILKRTTNRKEASVSAHGLTEGMPTGLHFERRVYDDISTQDIADSPDVIQKVNKAFDVSQNLKTLVSSHHRVVGTFYSHNDPLIYVRDKKDLDGQPLYHIRFKPATHDGTGSGTPVLMSQDALNQLKKDSSFNCQQLLDPTPHDEMRLDPAFLKPIDRPFIAKNLYRIMIIDQAGDLESNKGKGKDIDAWAMVVLGVNPAMDDKGQSEVTILDLWITPATESEAIEQAVRMYTDGGIIQKLGVEVTSQTKDHLHIGEALKKRGRNIVWGEANQHTSGVRLRPAGRHKAKFIESALAWPLNNSKWFYCTDIPKQYIDRLKQEMDKFPLWHDDGLNACAYLYDILPHCRFQMREQERPKDRPVNQIMAEQVLLSKW
jgi:hypothetical protein